MDEVERAKAEGWRFLGLKPNEVEALTPREFALLMRTQQERKFDHYENDAFAAMMHENAHRLKRPKMSDLFKRPVDAEYAEKKTKELVDKSQHATEWMSQFTLFSDNGSAGKE